MVNRTDMIKRFIFILVLLLIIIIAMIIYFLRSKNNNINISEENVIMNELSDMGKVDNENNIMTETENSEKEEKVLIKVNDVFTYFLIKQCVDKYYTYGATSDIIDQEANEALNGSFSDVLSENESTLFCIDKIYKQNLDSGKNIYLVYYRVEEEANNYKQTAILVKIDEQNEVFSIYPYEYLRLYNYLDLKEQDVVSINSIEELEKKENNIYNTEEIVADNLACMKELFAKYKFDLLLDLEHLYSTIDEEYKNIRFENFESFKQYIQDNKMDLYLDTLTKYQVNKYSNYVQFVGICNSDNHFIFNFTSLTEYTLLLDNYTIELPQYLKTYSVNLPNVQAKYCIDRFLKAINDKNYEFAYSKLIDVQKYSTYPNLEIFKSYMEENLFDKNNYEFGEMLDLSENVYQYTVILTDSENQSSEFKTFIATITLKNNADFTILFKLE